MNKPDPNDPSKYDVQKNEGVTIRVVSFGVAPLVKAALDGQAMAGPPFVFTVDDPPGALHVVSVGCDFPPQTPAGLQQAKHEIYVKGSRGGFEYLVTTIFPETRLKEIDLKFFVH